MLTTRDIFIYIFVIFVSTKESLSCFSYNQTIEKIIPADSTFYIDCKCQDNTKTKPDLEWRKEGKAIGRMGTQEGMHTELDSTGRQLDLYITVNKAAEGSYECVSTSKDGRYVSVTYILSAPAKLYFFNTNTTQYLIEGQDSLLTCEVRGDQPVLISWYRNQNPITNDNKYQLESNGLRIKNVKIEDGGVYNCSASGSVNGETIDQYITTEVLISPLIQNITAHPSDTVEENSKLVIKCNADGYPEPQYSFIKIPHSNNITWIQDYDTIIINNVTEEYRGVYECTAQNEAGLTKKQIAIEVHTKPTITHFMSESVVEKENVHLQCKASGRPRPRIIVNKVDSDLRLPSSEQSINDMETEYNLTINKVSRNHSGLYYCNASNKVDFEYQTIELSVLYRPSFLKSEEIIYSWIGKEVILNCDYDSKPESDVSWRYLGEIYGKESSEFLAYVNSYKELALNITDNVHLGTYECTANNSLGHAKKTFKVKAGFVPPKFDKKKVTLTDITATSVTFVIEDHYQPGPRLTGYVAEYDLTSAYEETSVHPTRTWANVEKYTLTNLQPGNSYTIKFAAQNEVGYGEYSDSVTFDTPNKSVPEQLKLEANANYIEIPANQKVLKLQPAKDNGSPVTFYRVMICLTEEHARQCLDKEVEPTTEVKLDYFNLKPNTTYLAKLEAHNALGNSEATIIKVTVLDSEETDVQKESFLTAGVIIGISVMLIILCILLLDLLLFFTLKKGIIASCCQKKNKNRKEDGLTTRDKKGLLKDNNGENDTLKRDNGHKEFEYNKETGIITGKHSSV
ncbi:fasciclin-2-like [Hyposmocoma kahamanoa]|uniref:fasciclin-2-like n=1 Tax=Hyposmocoma kahamanoa TaxID=1477025 RepID=UPI000E6D8A8C|nr:fasciclin-2-like [Hyposmocoma kahamanoa]